MLAVVDSAARRFLTQLGPKLPSPTAVVVISAHYDTATTEVTAGDRPETIRFQRLPTGALRAALSRSRRPGPRGASAPRGPAQASSPRPGPRPRRLGPLSLMLLRADVPVLVCRSKRRPRSIRFGACAALVARRRRAGPKRRRHAQSRVVCPRRAATMTARRPGSRFNE
jgi:hypothetical protein